MTLSIIITTYNAPEWLEKVLWGYQQQSFRDFEVLVADDGSGEPTRQLIEKMRGEVFYPLQHIWHEDIGFRKCTILNKAIQAATTDYLLFTDGDCIPRADFVEVHVQRREKGYFLSGGYLKLPMELSKTITRSDIETGNCFNKKWLRAKGLPGTFRNSKLTHHKAWASVLNALTPTSATWNGHNVSGWKEDIVAVNGYDERMRYGALDRELGERMMNNGIRGKQIRYSAVCIHLDHSRGYRNEKDLNYNARIRAITKKEKRTWTDAGITPSNRFPALERES
ncbi:MAG: glycosyltransferase family 2 protein [Chitinophagaceae bacterium]